MKVFAERLKELREEKGISKSELARNTGYSVMAISRWERNIQTPSVEVLVSFAKYFDVSADYLCGLSEE